MATAALCRISKRQIAKRLAETSGRPRPDVPLGRYCHHNGNLREVIDFAWHSETLEWMVVYRARYGDFGLWVRPAAMFIELVSVEGQSTLRSQYLQSN